MSQDIEISNIDKVINVCFSRMGLVRLSLTGQQSGTWRVLMISNTILMFHIQV